MGKLERLRNFRIQRYEIYFMAASGGMYYGAAHLPTHTLAAVCLGSALAVKAVGLPVQIVKIIRDRIPGMSLIRNLLDYQSYLLWGLYGEAIHSSVLEWGQYPGAVLVWIITWLNIRHGSFRWRLKPNSFGHYDVYDCRACQFVDLSGRKVLDPDGPGYNSFVARVIWSDEIAKSQIPQGKSEWPMTHGNGCSGQLHAFKAEAVWTFFLEWSNHPALVVICSSCRYIKTHQPRNYYDPGSCRCWWCDPPVIDNQLDSAQAGSVE